MLLFLLLQSIPPEADEAVGGMQDVIAIPVAIALLVLLVVTVIAMRRRRS